MWEIILRENAIALDQCPCDASLFDELFSLSNFLSKI